MRRHNKFLCCKNSTIIVFLLLIALSNVRQVYLATIETEETCVVCVMTRSDVANTFSVVVTFIVFIKPKVTTSAFVVLVQLEIIDSFDEVKQA